MFPIVRVSGTPYERGRLYGSQARDRVHRSLAAYAQMYAYLAGMDWHQASTHAQRLLPAIEDFAPSCLDEMAGIAAGAGVSVADVVALNARTEIMYSARVRMAMGHPAPAECSSFATATPDGRVVAGQNWDWVPFARDTVVVLEATPDDGPAFLTVVEAGLLSKFGVNSEGLAVMTNALACIEDEGDVGVPYHVLLHELLACGSTAEASARLQASTRASSANYLLADSGGSVVDFEARPGGPSSLHRIGPDERGVLWHTNHFAAPDFDTVDYADLVVSTSQTRLDRVTELVQPVSDPGDLAIVEAALTDHKSAPDSVCRHPDPGLPALDQTMTVTSAVVDMTGRRVRVSEGPPCESGYEVLDTTWLWN
jgi:isopenicillin-N N-acyltransferase-like protein